MLVTKKSQIIKLRKSVGIGWILKPVLTGFYEAMSGAPHA